MVEIAQKSIKQNDTKGTKTLSKSVLSSTEFQKKNCMSDPESYKERIEILSVNSPIHRY